MSVVTGSTLSDSNTPLPILIYESAALRKLVDEIFGHLHNAPRKIPTTSMN